MDNDAYEWGIYATFTGFDKMVDINLTEYEKSKNFISDEEKQQCNANGYCETKINDPFYVEIAWRQMDKIVNWTHKLNMNKSDMVLIKYVQNACS